MTHSSWFDWITVAAILIGPVLALFAQRILDWVREKKERRVQLYVTSMSLRGTWLHPDSIRALNAIDTIFDRRSDKTIRDAWANVIKHVASTRPDPQNQPNETRAWGDRLLDLRVDLYQLLGSAVGYSRSVDYIKTHMYVPQYHVDIELEQATIRRQFAKAISDDGLKVVVTNNSQNVG